MDDLTVGAVATNTVKSQELKNGASNASREEKNNLKLGNFGIQGRIYFSSHPFLNVSLGVVKI